MNRLIFISCIIFLNFSFSQSSQIDNGLAYPTFKDCNINEKPNKKIQRIKDSIQKHIARNISPNYLKKILQVNDSIEFSYSIIIGSKGDLLYNKTKVGSTLTSFNREISKSLNKLPRFTPGKSIKYKETYDYNLVSSPEFYIDKSHNLTPIYREIIDSKVNFISNDLKILKKQDSVLKTPYNKNFFQGNIYFSLDNKKGIRNIRVYSQHRVTDNFIIKSVKNLKKNNLEIFTGLKKNKNYSLPYTVNFSGLVSIQSFRPAIFPNCSYDDAESCLINKVKRFVEQNFNKDIVNYKTSFNITFKTTSTGYLVYVKNSSKNLKIALELNRIFKLLPRIYPKIENNIPVNFDYSFKAKIKK